MTAATRGRATLAPLPRCQRLSQEGYGDDDDDDDDDDDVDDDDDDAIKSRFV